MKQRLIDFQKVHGNLGFGLIFGLLFGVASLSRAAMPPMVSQVISAADPIVDEFGHRLLGTEPGAGYFGLPVVEGDVVHIYLTTDGNKYAPGINGTPDARNILLKSLRIGVGAKPNDANPGKFGNILSPRPGGGSRIFVRVFNAPDLESASFYNDSQVFTVSSVVNEPFVAEFASAPVPLDTGDTDGDGVINSWEISYGLDAENPDTDGDHLLDGEELIAGTDANDGLSMFIIADMLPVPPAHMLLTWQTQDGRHYTVESKADLSDESEYTVVDTVSGNGSMVERLVPSTPGATALYRVKVELDALPE